MGGLEASWDSRPPLQHRMCVSSWIWEASWGGLGGLLGRLEAKLGAKMVPSWVPRGRFLGSKNEAKMDALSGASWGRHFHGFWFDYGKQNGAKLALEWSATSIELRKGIS